ncbi:NAD(P)-dependent dehydrogenase, short-chain alcohol dehydrogenase family [Halopseudomonas sabulinigri]|uniref:NAD(P)-dependent dehydrogenase, short-chain alcohol dehydrogenase family n=1 Tax=Halopseudomonas sabulinigri TaxID=472181 RepID=A0A1H1XE72_9GAMM|nr:SDR family NAD(P)-dependent oxidoreductase [Halopseudomonas sabulinigri]SDT07603.1 NAD(P)-dependent dehydrogenase, short-chain alcohol dehydrogenase family [Halopseudomonas sabulinigri]
MSEFAGKTIVISGGAEGIGFSIAMAMGKQGMKVVLGDIDGNQLKLAEERLQQAGIDVLTAQMDVTKLEQWQALADKAIERFGKIHMLVNNAGVGGGTGTIEQTDNTQWRWVMDVNLMGVINGTQVMVPLIKQHGEGGWLLNVASMAGMGGVPYGGAYTASKVAVVAMSESWYAELQPHKIQVSVLCPAFVKTRINLSSRNRQSDYQSADEAQEPNPQQDAIAAHMQKIIDNGLPVEIVGERVVEALKMKELYIFTHPNYRPSCQARAKAIDDAFVRAAASPLLADVLDQEIVRFN